MIKGKKVDLYCNSVIVTQYLKKIMYFEVEEKLGIDK